MDELIAKTEAWAKDKGIFEHSSPFKQHEKFQEEAAELEYELHEWSFETAVEGHPPTIANRRNKSLMELGDCLVTLILLAKLFDSSAQECLQMAFDKISKRKGEMVDGFFVKENRNDSA